MLAYSDGSVETEENQNHALYNTSTSIPAAFPLTFPAPSPGLASGVRKGCRTPRRPGRGDR
eukprot:6321971-Prymnesium_polylepis.1